MEILGVLLLIVGFTCLSTCSERTPVALHKRLRIKRSNAGGSNMAAAPVAALTMMVPTRAVIPHAACNTIPAAMPLMHPNILMHPMVAGTQPIPMSHPLAAGIQPTQLIPISHLLQASPTIANNGKIVHDPTNVCPTPVASCSDTHDHSQQHVVPDTTHTGVSTENYHNMIDSLLHNNQNQLTVHKEEVGPDGHKRIVAIFEDGCLKSAPPEHHTEHVNEPIATHDTHVEHPAAIAVIHNDMPHTVPSTTDNCLHSHLENPIHACDQPHNPHEHERSAMELAISHNEHVSTTLPIERVHTDTAVDCHNQPPNIEHGDCTSVHTTDHTTLPTDHPMHPEHNTIAVENHPAHEQLMAHAQQPAHEQQVVHVQQPAPELQAHVQQASHEQQVIYVQQPCHEQQQQAHTLQVVHDQPAPCQPPCHEQQQDHTLLTVHDQPAPCQPPCHEQQQAHTLPAAHVLSAPCQPPCHEQQQAHILAAVQDQSAPCQQPCHEQQQAHTLPAVHVLSAPCQPPCHEQQQAHILAAVHDQPAPCQPPCHEQQQAHTLPAVHVLQASCQPPCHEQQQDHTLPTVHDQPAPCQPPCHEQQQAHTLPALHVLPTPCQPPCHEQQQAHILPAVHDQPAPCQQPCHEQQQQAHAQLPAPVQQLVHAQQSILAQQPVHVQQAVHAQQLVHAQQALQAQQAVHAQQPVYVQQPVHSPPACVHHSAQEQHVAPINTRHIETGQDNNANHYHFGYARNYYGYPIWSGFKYVPKSPTDVYSSGVDITDYHNGTLHVENHQPEQTVEILTPMDPRRATDCKPKAMGSQVPRSWYPGYRYQQSRPTAGKYTTIYYMDPHTTNQQNAYSGYNGYYGQNTYPQTNYSDPNDWSYVSIDLSKYLFNNDNNNYYWRYRNSGNQMNPYTNYYNNGY